MGRATNRLTHRFVQTVKEPGRYADGGGLYLYLDKPKASDKGKAPGKRWVFMFTLDGVRREMGLGSAAPNAVKLADARTAADAARKLVAAGLNPIEERKKAPAAVVEPRTFGQVTAELVADLKGGWKSAKHAKQWTASLKTHAAPLWDRSVVEIDTEAVLAVMRPIWIGKAETASRVRGRIEHVLDAARVAGDITGAWENPARWKGHLARLLGKRSKLQRGHHPAMPFAQLPTYMGELRQREGFGALALEFTILTAARTTETTEARPREFDLEAAIWTVPPERMKGGREHRVPLPPRAVEIVREILAATGAGPDDWLFPGLKPGKHISSGTMERVLDRMGQGHYTVHGMRSSFKSWATEATNFANDLSEAALAHLVGDETERAYRRSDALLKRRKLMEAWASYLARPVARGQVVAFGRPAPDKGGE